MSIRSVLKRLGGLAIFLTVIGPAPASADAVSDFYGNKPLVIYVGFGPGGGYDLYARLVAQHWGKFIPGRPNVIVKNMSGGGTRKAAAYLTNVTPQDGGSVGMFLDSLTLGIVLRGGKQKFDPSKFVWIGRITSSISVAVLWHTAPARSVQDATQREITLAATGPTSTSAYIPIALNNIVGTKFKPINGYRGSSAGALAMERGETHGMGAIGWEALKTRKADWLRDGKINFLYVFGTQRHKELPNVPALTEFAKNPKDLELLTIFGSSSKIGRAIAGEPGIPKDRAAALRQAFMAMSRDPVYLADAKKRRLGIDPLDGEGVQRVVDKVMAMPKPLVDRIKTFIKK